MSDDWDENPSKSSSRGVYAALTEPPFLAFSLGILLVQVGTGAQSIAIAWEVYVRTDSAMALAMVGLVQTVPMLLFTLPAGYLADVLDRRKLMLAGMAGTTLTSLALAAFSYAEGFIAVVYLLPMYVRDVIDLDGTGIQEGRALGWLRPAPAVGAMVMALILAHAPPVRKAGATMLWAVAAFGVATIIFGLSTNLWLSLGMLALTGAFDNISAVVRHTLCNCSRPTRCAAASRRSTPSSSAHRTRSAGSAPERWRRWSGRWSRSSPAASARC